MYLFLIEESLQYCIGFCHTSTWISHRYTYVPSLCGSTFFLIQKWLFRLSVLVFQLNYASEMFFQVSVYKDWLHLLFITTYYFIEWRNHHLFNHLLTKEHCFLFFAISENTYYFYSIHAIISVGLILRHQTQNHLHK